MIMYSKPLLNPNAVLFFGPIPTWWGSSRPWPQVEVHASDPVVVLVRYDDLPTKAVWPLWWFFFAPLGWLGWLEWLGWLGNLKKLIYMIRFTFIFNFHFIHVSIYTFAVLERFLQRWALDHLVNLGGTIWATSTMGSNAVSIPGGFNHKIAGNCAILIKFIKANWATEGL